MWNHLENYFFNMSYTSIFLKHDRHLLSHLYHGPTYQFLLMYPQNPQYSTLLKDIKEMCLENEKKKKKKEQRKRKKKD